MVCYTNYEQRVRGVIPTFIIDWPVLILIGLVFGFGVKGTPDRSVFATRAFFSGFIVLSLFITTVVYSYFAAPDWMFMYYVDADTVPGWIVSYILALYYLAFIFGFTAKFELAKVHKFLPWIALVLVLIGSAGVILPVADQYLTITTYEDYMAGKEGIALSESVIGKGFPFYFTPIVVLMAILGLIWSRRQKFV